MGLLSKFRRLIGAKNKYAVKEIKDGNRLRAAVLFTDEEVKTMSKTERLERFRKWRKEQGV